MGESMHEINALLRQLRDQTASKCSDEPEPLPHAARRRPLNRLGLARVAVWLAVWLLVAALAGVACLVMVSKLRAAPAPFTRPAKPAPPFSLVGEWWLSWEGLPGKAIFRADGSYQHTWRGCTHVGSWLVDGKGVLRVCETSTPENPGAWLFWSVPLNRGKLESHAIKLDRQGEESKVPVGLSKTAPKEDPPGLPE